MSDQKDPKPVGGAYSGEKYYPKPDEGAYSGKKYYPVPSEYQKPLDPKSEVKKLYETIFKFEERIAVLQDTIKEKDKQIRHLKEESSPDAGLVKDFEEALEDSQRVNECLKSKLKDMRLNNSEMLKDEILSLKSTNKEYLKAIGDLKSEILAMKLQEAPDYHKNEHQKLQEIYRKLKNKYDELEAELILVKTVSKKAIAHSKFCPYF